MPGTLHRVFATIAGGYPASPAPSADDLRDMVCDQVACGLGMISDGTVHLVVSKGEHEAVIDRWRTAEALARELSETDGLEPPLVKACLVGPATLSALGHDAGHLRALLIELFRAGAAVVQVNEQPGVPATARDHWSRLLEDVDGHVSLAILGGALDDAGAEAVVGARFTSFLFDLISGPDNWRVAARLPGDRGLIVGVADARTDRPDTDATMVWAARYAASMRGRGAERVGLAPSIGLEGLPRPVARAKLTALAEASRKAGLAGSQLALELDPRAVDARSAALGRYQPAPPRSSPPRT
jgi:hypothetical protein